MESLLVTGGSGLLGSAIVREAIGKFQVCYTFNKNPISLKGAQAIHADLLNDEDLRTLSQMKPKVVVHCAALTNVDYCESHSDEAHAQNVVVSVRVAEIARKLDTHLIHISTDGVFNGTKGSYSENDPPDPVNSYAVSKLEAERKVLETYNSACIVRTNIFGWNPTPTKSMAEWMIGMLSSGKTLTAFNDVVTSPLLANDLATILFKLSKTNYSGVIHAGSRDSCSKFEFANHLAEVFMLQKEQIKPISVDDLHLIARRPKNTSLDVHRISSLLGCEMPSVLDGVRRMREVGDTRRAFDVKD